jgi:arabinose-5-phosphate isomerase
MLAMGDALAVVLINKRHFNTGDFKRVHPAGVLGQRLSSKVEDIMLTGDHIPIVSESASMAEAIREIDRPSLGATFVVDSKKRLKGILTDGDIRRSLIKNQSIFKLDVNYTMTRNPLFLGPAAPVYDALNIMEQHAITVLPIVDNQHKIIGVLHLHDILGKGEFKFNGR